MLYSFRVIIDGSENFVEVNAATANTKGVLIYKGKQTIKLKYWLERQTGTFGHILGGVTTPIDLDYVFRNNCPWRNELVTGQVFNYSSGVTGTRKT